MDRETQGRSLHSVSLRTTAFRIAVFVFASVTAFCAPALAASNNHKPPLSLDEFFSYVEIHGLALSPDGTMAVIGTERPDWKQNRFRDDLWIWRAKDSSLAPLTTTGHDSDPHFSPDGKYIAFRSNRPLIDEAQAAKDAVERVWILPVRGGAPFPLYREPLSVDAYTWSCDGHAIFFATQQPISKDAETAEKQSWKDTVRWRAQRRGDDILRVPIAVAIPQPRPLMASESIPKSDAGKKLPLPADATVVAESPLAIMELVASPDGETLAFESRSVLNRQENPADYEIFSVPADATAATPRQLTHNQAYESELHWSRNSKILYFTVPAASGSAEQAYEDVQGRLYGLDIASMKLSRLGGDYAGNWDGYSIQSDGSLLGRGQSGIQTQIYSVSGAMADKLRGVAGSYDEIHTARNSPRLLFSHSGIDEPAEVYIAEDSAHLAQAKQITHFNKLFTERALPRWKAYRWKSQDGTPVEGVLLYPPGKFGQKHLRMFTLIHGGPADADGDRFGADWYDWAILAADNNWLVFRPNYRGSSGYGDKFQLRISPRIVSLPGTDILAGVDKLVADGIADPDHLAVGGYSYGGYMTNWLITQTTRFRSAVSGAGAVEHAANWGNDDMSYDDAWMLGGTPWQNPARYQSEAALFQFEKVKTPVHDVIGGADIRVSAEEGYLLERALQTQHIPHKFLVFPGEGHGLANNPWHGYIKVRDELLWLEKYDRAGK
ncbi:MAG: S9 family peptidase [Acidobacteriaceae bacterium]